MGRPWNTNWVVTSCYVSNFSLLPAMAIYSAKISINCNGNELIYKSRSKSCSMVINGPIREDLINSTSLLFSFLMNGIVTHGQVSRINFLDAFVKYDVERKRHVSKQK